MPPDEPREIVERVKAALALDTGRVGADCVRELLAEHAALREEVARLRERLKRAGEESLDVLRDVMTERDAARSALASAVKERDAAEKALVEIVDHPGPAAIFWSYIDKHGSTIEAARARARAAAEGGV